MNEIPGFLGTPGMWYVSGPGPFLVPRFSHPSPAPATRDGGMRKRRRPRGRGSRGSASGGSLLNERRGPGHLRTPPAALWPRRPRSPRGWQVSGRSRRVGGGPRAAAATFLSGSACLGGHPSSDVTPQGGSAERVTKGRGAPTCCACADPAATLCGLCLRV